MVRRGEDGNSEVRNSREGPIEDRERERNISGNNDGKRTKDSKSNTGRSRRDFMTDDIVKALMGGTGLAAAAGLLASDDINGGAYDEKEGVSHLESGQGLRLEGDKGGTFIIGHEPYEGQHFVFYGRIDDDWDARPVSRGEETQIDFSQYGEGLGTAEVQMTKDWGISAHLNPKDIVVDDEVYESNEGVGISTATADVSIPSGLNIEGELYGDGEGFKVTDEYDERIQETLESR